MFVGLLKALLKLGLFVIVGAVVAGAVALLKRPKDAPPVSYDEWPDVPQNPASEPSSH